MSTKYHDVFFEGAFFHLKSCPSQEGDEGRVRVTVGGDREIWAQFSICVGADYFL